MVTIKLHSPIANESGRWFYELNGETGVFSLEQIQSVFAANEAETDFRFDIHCPGGEVEEGLAIYDFLRSSGKNIHMNIEGVCHSMAVTLLLAAPAENRSANPNCVALIHKVFGCSYEGTADDMEAKAKEIRMLQDKILNIYADRTGMDRAQLEQIMNEERRHPVEELLAWGFVTKVNSYNTNISPKTIKTMNITELKNEAAAIINRITGLCAQGAISNYEFVDENGDVLFTTEAESDELEVGMKAEPDGEFVIADGRTVVVAEGVITEIREAEAAAEPETEEPGEGEANEGEEVPAEEPDKVAELEAKIAELEAEIEALKAGKTEAEDACKKASNVIRELRANIGSNHAPAKRMGSKASATRNELSKEERKSNLREAYGIVK